MKARLHGLYVIADRGLVAEGQLTGRVEQALLGGATVIQYRNKLATTLPPAAEPARIRELCRSFRALFIVNDDVALALQLDADGVHLGRDDMPIAAARAALGAQSLIGASCYNDVPRARAAEASGADYVAFGSFFLSPTKPRAVRADVAILSEARALLNIPIVAIGGITPENGGPLIEAGADALAVASGVIAQADAGGRARAYAQLFVTA